MQMLQKVFVQLLDMLHLHQPQKSPAQGYIDYFSEPLFSPSMSLFSYRKCGQYDSFIGRLFRHGLEVSRPKSVLVNLLSVCISLLDPRRLTSGTYYMYTRQMDHTSRSSVNPETIQGMLESLGKNPKFLLCGAHFSRRHHSKL